MTKANFEALNRAECFEMGRSCACANLRKAARLVTQLYDESIRPSGLRGTQFALLMAVKGLGPVTVTKLAQSTMMDRTTLGRNLRPLEKRRLIRIMAGEDQRVREITLTDQGLEALMKAMPFWKKAQSHMIEGLGEERLNTFLNDLAAVASVARMS
ncbi:MAG: winged helix-turn-helix transcriptional regulator [Desulfobacteraceae bacterium]|nr:MAG: winged helix-turn-helix transcriptional regulator [Desulfobacteraceae bacterium]